MKTITRIDEIVQRNTTGRHQDIAFTAMIAMLLATFLTALPF